MNIGLIVAKFFTVMRKGGLRRAVGLSVGYLRRESNEEKTDDDFDAVHGTDTAGRVPLWHLRIDSPHARFGVRYEASDSQTLQQAIGVIREDPHGLTFIDLGCGKGRMLLLASELGFRRIVGVEFSPELASIAEVNLRKVQAADASVITMDAAEYEVPDDDFIIYLFNPFSNEVMSRVVENIRRSRANRKFVVYNCPYCAELFDLSGFLRRLEPPVDTRTPISIWASIAAPVE